MAGVIIVNRGIPVVLGSVAAASTLSLTAAAPTSATTAPNIGRHCVIDLTGHRSMTCHASFQEAIAVASAGHIADAPDDPATAVRSRAFNARVNGLAQRSGTASALVTSIEYDGTQYSGPSIVFTHDKVCTASNLDIDDNLSALPAGWDNRISSFHGYSGCRPRHWEEKLFGGAFTEYQDARETMGIMDNQASSLSWT
ncbi:hypothetical protein [Actinomadura rubrisoli]|uniref:Uncharacterized protein n=1 Tax=Actinomadura rubrisoli TaxID=2530368 RepID=A0A4R5CHV1_9ACTN|nr:hypothetical protein [Actinomadura rubrisoli]TDD98110.1 hypothetical protein E1298_00125 [Actinomadura rubrisoli]